MKLVVLLDDAYFGLFYEDSIKESLFGLLADTHPNILPVKIDGATKENYVWGLRVGFITYAADSRCIRCFGTKNKRDYSRYYFKWTILSQTIILESLQSPDFQKEKRREVPNYERSSSKNKTSTSK